MKTKLLMSALLTSSFLIAAPVWAAGEVIGINSAVKGDVTIADEERAIREAIVKDNIRLGEEVTSSRDSTLQVLLNDETVFTVGPDCVLTVDTFVFDPSNNNNSMTAKIKKGMFRFTSGKTSNPAKKTVSIDTPVASMGIRGTIVEGLVGQDAIDLGRRMGVIPEGAAVDMSGASLFILRGPGQNHASQNRKGEIDVTSGGKTITVAQSGYGALVPANGADPIGPFPVPDEIFDFFSDQLRTKPKSNLAVEPVEIEFYDVLSESDWPGDDREECIITPIEPGDNRGDDYYEGDSINVEIDFDYSCLD